MEEKVIIQQKPPKSPALAGILGLFLPFGAGPLYNGQYPKALFSLITFAGLITIQDSHGAQPFVGIVLAGFIAFQFFDSINSAKAINLAAAGKPAEAVKMDVLPQIIPSGSIFWGSVLIVIGILATLANFDVIMWETLWDFWPVAVIAIGLKLVYDSIARKNGKAGK